MNRSPRSALARERRILSLATLVVALAGSPARTEIRFAEVSSAWGLVFQHHHGGSGRYYMPETDGSGVVLFDYDGDGDVDVLFIDGGSFPGYEGEPPRSVLYRNEEGSRFADVTAAAGITTEDGYGMGGAAGDVDGDGDIDLYLTAFGANRLLRNDGDGGFTEVTAESGVGDERWSSSAAFADVDLDGDLDLYVANYLIYSLETHRRCGDEESGFGYCHPALLDGERDRFYRNRGDGTFEDGTDGAGFAAADGKGLGVVFSDLDGDGDPDLYVANDTTANFFYRNLGDGTFEDQSLLSGAALSDRAEPEAGMGIAIGDFEGNGLPDLYVTNFALETNALYRNVGDGLFIDARHVAGVAEPSIPMLGFGTAFADFDLDGDLDLAVANGHILDNVEQIHEGLFYAQPNQILEQVAPGRLRVVEDAGLEAVRVSRGLAVGDLDRDGDPDLVITNSNDRAEVYENRSGAGGWLQLDLVGRGSNTAGIGARVEVESGTRRRVAEVMTASSYLSQNETTLHFGLGGGSEATVAVRWPNGRAQRFEGLPADRRIRVRE